MSDVTRIPAHADGAVLAISGPGPTLSGPRTEPLVLDPTALALWELCDGETTVEEMVTAAGTIFDAPEEQLRVDIVRTLDELAASGLLVWVNPAGPSE